MLSVKVIWFIERPFIILLNGCCISFLFREKYLLFIEIYNSDQTLSKKPSKNYGE